MEPIKISKPMDGEIVVENGEIFFRGPSTDWCFFPVVIRFKEGKEEFRG